MGKKNFLILPLLLVAAIVAHILVAGGLTVFSEDLNKLVFNRKHVESYGDKVWLAQTLGLWLSIFLFSLAVMIMSMRIITGKNPVTNTDPLYISTLNRVITNTIEQTIIFAGLYAPILFSERDNIENIGATRVLSLAALFVVGRVTFAIGYIVGAATGLPTLRSFGFAIGLLVNLTLVAYHLGFNAFQVLDQHAHPLIKSFL